MTGEPGPDVARFQGGPLSGKTMVVGYWPPPSTYEHDGCVYELVAFSQLPEPVPHVIRGAEYRAREPVPGEEAT